MAVWLGAVLVLTSGMVACDQETEPRTSSDGGRPRNVRPECTGAARLDDECRDRIRPPIALVYLEGTALVTEDLRGRSREFTDLTTEDVAASASGRHVAYVTGSPPTLNLFTPATDSRVPLGPGIDPVWSQIDNRLAWLQPTKPCEGETCVPEGKVVAQEIGVGEERVLLESGTWRILGWAGSSLHVADPSQPEQVLSVPGDGAGRPTEM
ncbi:MAG TPA: hypothetical protein VHJ82_07970, partial [Actinomycetota bacterium]|nr:hypothetical protein [Actinomycetota bacterium]